MYAVKLPIGLEQDQLKVDNISLLTEYTFNLIYSCWYLPRKNGTATMLPIMCFHGVLSTMIEINNRDSV